MQTHGAKVLGEIEKSVVFLNVGVVGPDHRVSSDEYPIIFTGGTRLCNGFDVGWNQPKRLDQLGQIILYFVISHNWNLFIHFYDDKGTKQFF